MGKRTLLIGVLLVICVASSLAVNIDNEVEDALSDNGEVSVIIKLKDDQIKQKGFGAASKKELFKQRLEIKKSMIENKQAKVLSKLNNKDLKLRHKYHTINAFSGKITRQALEKLKQDPDIESIFIDRTVHVTLDASIPRVNADDVWSLQLNSINITGAGETICIIDTGVDYTHPGLGGCSITQLALNGTNQSYILESAHNYSSSFNYTWNITNSTFSRIAVHFKNISTESNYDYVKVYDNNSRILAVYSGSHQDLWSPYSEGSTIYVELVTDTYITDYGFYIDYIINGTTNTTYNWSGCSKVIGGWDIVNSDPNPMDDNGHGTHCAGIVSSDNETYKGVAPDSKIVAIKSMSSGGTGTSSDIIAGIDWCVNTSSNLNISVISMSLGDNSHYTNYCDSSQPYFSSAINTAVGAGITVVAATGNNASIVGISSPACIQNTTPVGAVDEADSIIYQRGAILDILAPGFNIHSAQLNGGFVDGSGTSMATPHVAGAVALLQQFSKLQNGTTLTPAQMEETLKNTGKLIDDSGGFGGNYSRINVYAAIQSLDALGLSINFTSPTLPNNTITPNTSIIINVSVIDQLNNISSCWIEWNLTSNQTISKLSNGTSVTCYINRSINGSGTFYYKIYANDSKNNIGSSELRQINITNTAPNITSFYPNTTTINMAEPNNQTFNISYEDINNDAMTITWQLNGSNVSNSTTYFFEGNYFSAGYYNITIIISDGKATDLQAWNLTVNNTNRIPEAQNISLTSTESLNRTNGTLQAQWTFYDLDNETQQANETKWYNDSVEINSLANLTSISPGNTTKNQTWIFSVRVYDNINWSPWYNSSPLFIPNAAPEITSVSNITVNETGLINITVNAVDQDNDNLTYLINYTRFNQTNNTFTWQTNLSDSGTHTIRINATDGTDSDYQDIILTIIDSLDSDSDGNPDFNDTDDDNDGLNDTIDFLLGNVSAINTTTNISLYINGSTNTTQLFNGTFNITILEDNISILSFDFNITDTTQLNLYNVSIITGSDYIIVGGIPDNGLLSRKTVRINDSSASITSVCVKDIEVSSISELSSNCDSSSETLVICNGNNYSGYTCTDEGQNYLVTGLNHSAVKELCPDSDGDGYISSSCGGNDCGDNNIDINPGETDTCGNGIDEDCSGSDSSCPATSTGGGGGGGGSISTTSPTLGKSQYYPILIKGSSAKLSVDKPAVAVTKINFTVNKQISRATLSVETVNESIVPLQLEDDYSYFKVSLDNADVADIDNAVFNFRVNQSWLEEYDKYSVSLNRYTDSWEKLEIDFVSEDMEYAYYSALSPGFSYFAVTAEKPVPKPVETVEEALEEPIMDIEEVGGEIRQLVKDITEEEIDSVKIDKTRVITIISIIVILIIIPIIFLIFKSKFLYNLLLYIKKK